jgi:hypothetical protein
VRARQADPHGAVVVNAIVIRFASSRIAHIYSSFWQSS